ncbi:MAG: NUDIX hydrolase [Silicimonas sp.]|nr:NUDIX hydrolase [Silicimonas sp.]MBT8425020.1 NUDIX hydrolase [Silicimonas sp.]NNE59677.1 NUDIX hydrolase [Woeseia sp.]
MIRRVGEPVRSDINYKIRPGAYAVLFRKGALLLTHQAEPVPEYQLPGGGIDQGECPIPALHREVLEETGWRIGRLRRLGAFRRFTYMPEYKLWAEKICIVYQARPSHRLGPPTEAGHSAVWAPPEVAAKIVANPGDAYFIRKAAGLRA